jgi:hypothetical protein
MRSGDDRSTKVGEVTEEGELVAVVPSSGVWLALTLTVPLTLDILYPNPPPPTEVVTTRPATWAAGPACSAGV